MNEDENDEQKSAGRRMDKSLLMKLLTGVRYSPRLLERIAPADEASVGSHGKGPQPADFPANPEAPDVPDAE